MRRQWKKFGDAVGDKPGPNTATTLVGEEVFLQLTDNKEVPDSECPVCCSLAVSPYCNH